MKSKIATSLLLLLVLTGFRPPQKNATDKNPLTLDKPLSSDHSLLWQISGNGLSKPSYLYGTIHMISRDDYFLGKNVSKKLGKSEAQQAAQELSKLEKQVVSAVWQKK